MLKEIVTIDEVIELLNEIVESDCAAARRLVEARVRCNKKLAEHPTIQVGNYHKKGEFQVGILGVLNGLFGIDDETGYGQVSADIDGDKISFRRIIDFEPFKKK